MSIPNAFFLINNRYGQLELITPEDDGTIFPSIMRDTIIQLKHQLRNDHGIVLNERKISIHEVINAHKEDRLVEIIGCSTPYLLQPIHRLMFKDYEIEINTDKDSKYVSYLNNVVRNIMSGPESHAWTTSFA